MADDEQVDPVSGDSGNAPLIPDRLAIQLIALAAIAGIVLMCAIVAALAIWKK